MTDARGNCPNCGAATEFAIGASVSKVCPYCRHIIVRTDRDWRNLGRAADLADTPTVVSVGDSGTVRGTRFEVLGRIQVDYGQGPWNEYYASFGDGSWGWLTHAQGNLYVTRESPTPIEVPPSASLAPDQAVALGQYGPFRVAERRVAKVLSSEGELPNPPAPQRVYADLTGVDGAFATIDYGDGTHPPKVFVGHQVLLTEVVITPRGGEPTGGAKVRVANITCPNCGAALPPPSDASIERVGCRYCHALVELDGLKVIARQAAAYAAPLIPIGSTATLSGTRYTAIGYMERSATIEGEHFRWFEYLLYGERVGFRWLVNDEGNWFFTRAVPGGEINAERQHARWNQRTFSLRNRNAARVDYVVGEFYWKVVVGETTQVADFVDGGDVLSREEGYGEVNWSYSQPTAWTNIARAFNVNLNVAPPMPSQSGGDYSSNAYGKPSIATNANWLIWLVVIALVIVCIAAGGGGSGGSGGGGFFSGGGGSYGGFGGK